MLPMLAAVIYPKGCAIDALLDGAVVALQAEGLRVAGVVQQADPADPDCCDMFALRDVMSGELTPITENRGKHATACRLDPRGLVRVAAQLEAALDQSPDLMVLNRFGKAETGGGGLRSVLSEALLRGVPVLTAVRDIHVADWAEFHQGIAVDLPADPAALRAWVLSGHQLQAGHKSPD